MHRILQLFYFFLISIVCYSCGSNECEDFDIIGSWIEVKFCDSIGGPCTFVDSQFPDTWQFYQDGTFDYTPYSEDAINGAYQWDGTTLQANFFGANSPYVITTDLDIVDGCSFYYDPSCFEPCTLLFELEK